MFFGGERVGDKVGLLSCRDCVTKELFNLISNGIREEEEGRQPNVHPCFAHSRVALLPGASHIPQPLPDRLLPHPDTKHSNKSDRNSLFTTALPTPVTVKPLKQTGPGGFLYHRTYSDLMLVAICPSRASRRLKWS